MYLFFFFKKLQAATYTMAVHSNARTLRDTLLIYTGILRTIDINEKITRDLDCRISGISLYFSVVGPLDIMVIKRMFQKNASNRTATPYTKIVFDYRIWSEAIYIYKSFEILPLIRWKPKSHSSNTPKTLFRCAAQKSVLIRIWIQKLSRKQTILIQMCNLLIVNF